MSKLSISVNFVNFKPRFLLLRICLITYDIDIFFFGWRCYLFENVARFIGRHAAVDRISCRDILQSLGISVSRCLQVLDRQLTTDGTYWYIRSSAFVIIEWIYTS